MQRSDLQGWLQAGGHLLLFIATGTLTYLLFAVSHTYHHRYTLYPDGDRELVLPQNPMLKLIDLFQLFVFMVWRGHSGLIPVVVHTVKIAAGNLRTSSTFGTPDDAWVSEIFEDLPAERRRAIN